MKYKIVACDLDGTINNDEFEVSEENIQSIKKIINAGLYFILCSGRSPSTLSMYAKKMGINKKGFYGIGFNGGVVYEADTKKSLFESRINKDVAIRLIKDIKNVATDTIISVHCEQDLMLSETCLKSMLEKYNDKGCISSKIVDNLENSIKKDILNIVLIGERHNLEDIYNKIIAYSKEDCNIAFTLDNILEILPPSINKAEGLIRLTNHLGISMSEVVTIGDNYNDLEMLEKAGLGIAVANAVDQLKEVANYITKRDNNNHVMIEVVDKILDS